MFYIRQAVIYLILTAVVWGLATYVPRHLARVQIAEGYEDVKGLTAFSSYGVDRGVRMGQWRIGDALAFRANASMAESDMKLGYVAALPGDEIAMSGGMLLVNGRKVEGWEKSRIDELGPLVVPAGHLWVRSDMHVYDSVALGPIPSSWLHGRINGNLP